MLRQIHVRECYSTQDVLKEQLLLSPSESILVSCENQISGRGRGQNQWTSLPGSLCFSLDFEPHPVVSFTAIEIAVILTDFFHQKNIDLKLKWPNDLWTNDLKKCGGILVQGIKDQLLAGIGINIYTLDKQFGGIYDEVQAIDKKEFALEIAHFLKTHRIHSPEELKLKWLNRCGHYLKCVKITDGNQAIEGFFSGLGEFGEAIISTPVGPQAIFNGSLRLI